MSMLGPNQHNTNNLAKIKTQRASSWVRTQSREQGASQSKERQGGNQVATGIPSVLANMQSSSLQKFNVKRAWGRDSSQNRSREGSNIGRGISNFFDRRNSASAQGKRRVSISKENPLS